MWIAGHEGAVLVGPANNPVDLSATNWLVDWRCNTVDVSNFKGFGWGAYLDGVPDFNIRIEALWDSAENPFVANAPGVIPGDQIRAVLYLTRNDAVQRWLFPNILVQQVMSASAVRDTVRYTIVGQGSAYTAAFEVTRPGDA